MNYKSMILVALLLPVFFHSQSNEEHVTNLNEEYVTNLNEEYVTNLNEEYVTNLNEEYVTNLNEEHVTNLEERLATLEVHVLEIVSLVNKNKGAINAAMETTENSTCKLVGSVTLALLCSFIVLCKLYCEPLLP